MTIPLLLHIFPSFTVGGAQARFATLANRLGSRYRHAVVAMDGAYSCVDRLERDIDVTYPKVAVVKGDALGNLRRFRKMLRSIRPDLMVTSNWGSIEWAILNILGTVPHIHMEDGFGPDERERQLPRRVAARRLVLRRSIVMLPSLTLCKIATEQWRLDTKRLRYIPNGIDLAKFHPRATLTRIPDASLPDNRDTSTRIVIGSVAGLRPEKNVARLIQAFAILSHHVNAKLEIAGDGPERQELTALAKLLGVGAAVTFLGHVADPAALYRNWDIFALASDSEQMPISILEAMGAGLAVAATDVGDIRTMLSEENGPYLAALDADDLSAKLRDLASDTGQRRLLGAANRRRAEEFYTEAAMVDAHAMLFEEAIRERRPRRVSGGS